LNYNEGGTGKQLAVDFVYMGEERNGRWVPRDTQCQLFDTATEDVVAIGEAHTHITDQFCRKTGRKLAFDRALHAAAFDKATRAKLWAQFRQQVTL
jgi:crotonobetainyl-CoA:carnitine CoA-transferase CaiB-like acyl-CoA transferase